MQLAILPRATAIEPIEQQQQQAPPPPPPPDEQQEQEEQEGEQQQREQQQAAPAEVMVGVQEVQLDPSGELGVLWCCVAPSWTAQLRPCVVNHQRRHADGCDWMCAAPPSAVLFFALQQKRLRGRSGRSRNVVFSQDRGRYVKPVFPKGGWAVC